jgi:hypothetical protein
MSGWGMNPEALHAEGKKVADLAADASAAGKGFLDALDSARGAVHHPKLVTALSSYHGEWSKPANQLSVDVTSTGNKISQAAVIGRTADNDAQQTLTATGQSTMQGVSHMSRPINVGAV